MPTKRNIQKEVTDQIIAQLKAGTRPWNQPWEGGKGFAMPKRHNGESYQGINVLLLWCAAAEKGLSSPYWMTFNQAKKYGGHVRKGEKGSMIVFTKPIEVQDKTSSDPDAKSSIYLYKPSTVFNVDQIDGLPEKFAPPVVLTAVSNPDERIPAVDAYIANTQASISELSLIHI